MSLIIRVVKSKKGEIQDVLSFSLVNYQKSNGRGLNSKATECLTAALDYVERFPGNHTICIEHGGKV